MTERLSRLVAASNSSLKQLCSYINYACFGTTFVVRLLRDSSAETNQYTQESLFSVNPLIGHNEIISYDCPTVLYNGKVLDVIAECVFDTTKFFKHALRPLSNYLILLTDKSLIVKNYQLETSVSHFRVPEYIKSQEGRTICLAQIYTVNRDDILEDCSKSLFSFDGIETITEIDTSNYIKEDTDYVSGEQYLGKRYRFQAVLKLEALSESIEAEGSAQFKVSCILNDQVETSANFVVNIEPVDGYVPHRRVQLINGEATFTAYALHMTAGESMRIKVGLPFYAGLAECTIPVVASTAKEDSSNYVKSDELLIAELNAASKTADQMKEALYQYIDASIRNRFEAYLENQKTDD